MALRGLRKRGGAAAPQCWTRDDLGLPAHPIAAGWLQLPASAELLGLWRRGDRALWTLGRRLDDAGAAVALSALGHLGNRQCSLNKAARRAMVFALAVWTLARRQWPLISGCAAALSNEMRIAATPEQASNRCSWFDVFMGGRQQWAGKSVRPVTIPDRSILWRRLPLSSSSSRRGIISIDLLQRQVTQLSSCRAKTFGGKAVRLLRLA